MNILSLFDGMSCGMLALKNAGVPVENYYAYEIDKYAVQTAQHNFPEIQELGDVFKEDYTKYKGNINFLIGGSPCTYWSIAQSPDKREKTSSGVGWELFSQYVRALKEAKPDYFIYENNRSMAKAIYDAISETFGFEPIMINSALVSAQNRQRYYWVGKRNEDGTYNKVDVKQPEDRGILLKDILDSGMDLTLKDKSFAQTATYNGAVPQNTLERHQRNMIAEPVGVAQRGRYSGNGTEQHIEAREDQKSNCLTTVQKDCMIGEPCAVPAMIVNEATQKGYIEVNCGECFDYDFPNSKTRRGRKMDDKSNCLTTSCTFYQYTAYAIEFDEKGNPTKAVSTTDNKTYTVYRVKEGQISINNKSYPIKLSNGFYIIRKLTVPECKRLQTVPEWYEFPVSNSQAYKMLGNGWTVDVITHLIKSALKEK